MKGQRVVRVQGDRSDELRVVDLDAGSCTCGTRRTMPCSHLLRARDVHEHHCRNTRRDAVSALHKEIRRGDVEKALYWADLLTVYSEEYVFRYVRKIAAEETRNLAYWRMAIEPGRAGYRDLVAAIASSRKCWEHPEQCRLYELNMRGYLASCADEQDFAEPHVKRVVERLSLALLRRDGAAAYHAFWWLQGADDDVAAESVWPAVDPVLLEESSKVRGFVDLPWFLENWHHCADSASPTEVRTAMLEAIMGGWDESMNDFATVAPALPPPSDGSVLLRVEDCVHDWHTPEGKERVRRWQPLLRPGQPSPGRLDLRWSGQEMGVGWRHAAFRQHGSGYVRARWEDVEMSAEYWELLKRFDGTIPAAAYEDRHD